MHLAPEPVYVASISGFWRTSLQALEAVNKFGRDISFITYSGTMSHRSAVETAEQRDFLQSQQCHRMQGYLLSKPLPVDQAAGFLTATTLGKLA